MPVQLRPIRHTTRGQRPIIGSTQLDGCWTTEPSIAPRRLVAPRMVRASQPCTWRRRTITLKWRGCCSLAAPVRRSRRDIPELTSRMGRTFRFDASAEAAGTTDDLTTGLADSVILWGEPCVARPTYLAGGATPRYTFIPSVKLSSTLWFPSWQACSKSSNPRSLLRVSAETIVQGRV